jgi:hypothetical protein
MAFNGLVVILATLVAAAFDLLAACIQYMLLVIGCGVIIGFAKPLIP